MEDTRQLLRRFSIAWSRVEHAYCAISRTGVKESMMWLLYALDDGESHSQKTICEEWGIYKSTLNTTIKQAEKEGYLTLSPIPGCRREMTVRLTDVGREYASRVLRPIYEAEELAMRKTLEKYHIDFVDAMDAYAHHLTHALDEKL